MRSARWLRTAGLCALVAAAIGLTILSLAMPANEYAFMRQMGSETLPADPDGGMRVAITAMPAIAASLAAALALRSAGRGKAAFLAFAAAVAVLAAALYRTV